MNQSISNAFSGVLSVNDLSVALAEDFRKLRQEIEKQKELLDGGQES